MTRHRVSITSVIVAVLALMSCLVTQMQPSRQMVAGQAQRTDAGVPGTSSSPPVLALAHHGSVDTGDHVLTVITPSGDVTHVAEYLPAPGLSADQLGAHLGVNSGSEGGALSVAPASYGRCSYAYLETATTLCPMLHWSNAGHANPQVYYVDHTTSRWPVRQSTSAWNAARNIQLHYTRSGCPAGAHCVNVWDANFGNSCWQGMTTWSYDRYGNFINNSVDIRLNDYNGTGVCQGRSVNYYKNSAGYRQNICHEQGHTLGLDHNAAYDSCLYARIADSTSLITPDSNDLALLGWLYSTVH